MAANAYLTAGEKGILGRARVGIAGAGGLGSNCAMHLVRAGVEHFTICDFDVVCESNLNRQFYFRSQLGLPKVEALGANLRMIEPSLDLDLRSIRLDAANAEGVFAGCDVVVEALDSAEAKAMLIGALAPKGFRIVAASGIAGWGRSNGIRLRTAGANIVIAGDGATGVSSRTAPQSPRVGIAAAMQANAVAAWLLGESEL